MMNFDPRLVPDMADAARFLLDRIEQDGWKQWSWNYLREHIRCKHGAMFSNTVSPQVYDELKRRYPDLAVRIAKAERASGGQSDMF